MHITFDDEVKIPVLNNLATYVNTCKKRVTSGNPKEEGPSTADHINLKKSAEIMAAYLRDRELNPQILPTQKGFLQIFSTWILDESLPLTTGEAPTLKMLFKYL